MRLRNRRTATVSAILFLFLAIIAAAGQAQAQAQPRAVIEAGAAQNYFYIEPSYEGAAVTLFASVDREKLKTQPFDIAVTLRGPVKAVTVWKKDRRGLLWVNSESLTFEAVPNFYAVLSARPVAQIAPLAERKPFEIGLDAIALPPRTEEGSGPAIAAPHEFEEALIRLKKASGLFIEDSESAIEFLGERLFRARAFLPPAAGPGLYRANFYVFQNGRVVGAASSHIRLTKIGMEARLSSAAAEHPWLYGIAAVIIAAAIGGGASFVFSRD